MSKVCKHHLQDRDFLMLKRTNFSEIGGLSPREKSVRKWKLGPYAEGRNCAGYEGFYGELKDEPVTWKM